VSEQGPDSPFKPPELEGARSRSERGSRPSKWVTLLATTALLAIGVIAAVIGTREPDNASVGSPPVVVTTEPDASTEPRGSVVVEGSSGVLECYTFKRDNTVNLRRGGLPQVVDVGVVTSGEIRWESGRTSTVKTLGFGTGQRIAVDGVEGVIVEACR
jgi:hypothetical protein